MSNSKNKSSSILSQWKLNKKAEAKPKLDTVIRPSEYPASEGQQRLYFLDQLHRNNPVYNLTEVWKFDGPLDIGLFDQAIKKIGERHDLLRATFHLDGDEIQCRIGKEFLYTGSMHDLSQLGMEDAKVEFDSIAREVASTNFDLEAGPLMRVGICSMNDDLHKVVINLHHIISDKWSMRILRKELSQIYQQLKNQGADKLPTLTSQFYERTVDRPKESSVTQDATYWKEKLKQSNKTRLPSDIGGSQNLSLEGKYQASGLPKTLSESVTTYCKDNKITPFVFFLSAYKLMIARYSHVDDVTLATPVSTRTRPEYESIVGFFNDTVVLRNNVNLEWTCDELTQSVKQTVFEAFEHKEIGYQEVLSQVKPNRNTQGNPLFDMMFLYHQRLEEPTFAHDIQLSVSHYDMGVSKFDFTLYVEESKGGYETVIEYATDLYSQTFVERFLSHYEVLVRQLIKNPSSKIGTLEMLTTVETDTLTKLGTGPKIGTSEYTHILEGVNRFTSSEHIALCDERKRISYAVLHRKSNGIAEQLLRRGVTDGFVGILMEQSADFIVAMIGIMKAGCGYLPLDANYPQAHIEHAIEAAEINILITSQAIAERNTLEVEHLIYQEIDEYDSNPGIELNPSDPAYLIFTSGSTGTPNGVVVSHDNLLTSTLARFEYYERQPSSYLLLSSFSFDSSVAGIYWTLLNGGKIVIPSKDSVKDVDYLTDLIKAESITHTLLIPSLYQVYLELIPLDVMQNFEVVILAGEALTIPIARKHFDLIPEVKLYNEYGPTEATVWITAHQVVDDGLGEDIPIGRPIGENEIYVLDTYQNLMPAGLPGELYITGKSVTQGYLRPTAKASSQYATIMVNGQAKQAYRTGDWVKWNHKGELCFLGRKDHQVKIRGHRIELREIDATIQNLDHNLRSVTVFKSEEQLLITFIVGNGTVDTAQLSSLLRAKLPRPYWPDAVVQIEEYPMMSNGKTDIKALQSRSVTRPDNHHKTLAYDGIVDPLLIIWREVLKNDQIGIDDNFFDVGGDSIQLIRIVAKARNVGIDIAAKDMYNHQTVASLSLSSSQERVIEQGSLDWNYLPITPIQAWFFDLHRSEPNHWMQGYRLTLRQLDKIDRVKDVLRVIVESEAIFHTKFVKLYGKWHLTRSKHHIDQFFKVVDENYSLPSGLPLSEGPLIKFYLREDSGYLTDIQVIVHHAIIDAVSWHQLISRIDEGLGGFDTYGKRISEAFLRWTQEINLLAHTNLFDKDIPFWDAQTGGPSPLFSHAKVGIESDVKIIHRRIPTSVTLRLIATLGQYSSIKLNEAIISGFLQSVHQETGQSEVGIMIEGHGRDAEFTEVELSEAIGWFTSYYPVRFALSDPSKIEQSLIDVKEQIRHVPNKGISYGALRYLSEKLNESAHAKVTINHLGDLSHSEYQHFSNVTFLSDGMRSPLSERMSLIEINTHIDKGELIINYSYDAAQLDVVLMENICNQMVTYFSELSTRLETAPPVVTPSDYHYAISQSDLDKITLQNSNIDTIVPLGATQAALLFHHLQSDDVDQGLINASVKLNGKIDQQQLQQAWKMVVSSHDVLRSYFVWENMSSPVQVVSKQVDTPIEYHDQTHQDDQGLEEFIQDISLHQLHNLRLDKPPIYRLICVKISEEVHHLVFLCHHIYIDGWSTNVVFQDLIAYYDQLRESKSHRLLHRPILKNWYQQWSRVRDSEDFRDYWQATLSTAKPTLLKSPDASSVKTFASKRFTLSVQQTSKLISLITGSKLSLSIILYGTWSWLMSQYLDQNRTTIGMVHSGRSLSLDRVDHMVGMLSTALPMVQEHRLDGQIDYHDIQYAFNQVLSRDAVNVDDIPELSSSQTLYDTLLIIENFMLEQSKKQVDYTDFKSNISSLIPLCVVAVPGDELSITLRYNKNVYDSSEIDAIGSDIMSVLQNLTFEEKIATVHCQARYVVSRTESTDNLISNQDIIVDKNMNTEDALLVIWRDVLDNQDLTRNDNFFDQGGTSLKAVRIFNAINKQLGINASPILLLKHKTISDLTTVLQTTSVSDSWDCVYPLSEEGDSDPLFCFHAGDGHIMFYHELAHQFDNRPIYGIQPVGLDGEEMTFDNIEEMARFYLRKIKEIYPSGPYHLLGTCFSNAVTFEMARLLEDEMGHLIFVDSPPPYFKELSKMKKWLSWVVTFNIPKLWEAFNSLIKYAKWKAPADEQERNLFETGKQLRTVMSTYNWIPQDFQIVLIRSSENAEDPYKSYHIDNWDLLAKRGVVSHVIRGKHQTIFAGESALEMSHVIETILSENE